MGLFDRNGNGLLSRSDFTKAIKALKLKISIKKSRLLMEYIDMSTKDDKEIKGKISILNFV